MKQSIGTDVSVSISALLFTNSTKTVDCVTLSLKFLTFAFN
jgi:hypothetical protein